MGWQHITESDETVDGRTKATICRMFQYFNAPPFSTSELAQLLSSDCEKVKQLVRELKSEGKVGYCERFGLSDLCFGLPPSLPRTSGPNARGS